jgi:serine protease AprX
MTAFLGTVAVTTAPAAHADTPPQMDYLYLQCSSPCVHAGVNGHSIWSLLGDLGGYNAYMLGDSAAWVYVPEGNAETALRSAPGVAQLTANPTVDTTTPRSPDNTAFNPQTDNNSLYNVANQIGATSFWNSGYTGQGVDVAVIDSGVAPSNYFGTRLVDARDLSFDASDNGDTTDPSTPSQDGIDGFGHGTHIAGIIGGADPRIKPVVKGKSGSALVKAAKTEFVGIAPGSRIINVRAGASNGAVDVSQMVAAIDWVVLHQTDSALGAGTNIRVLNLSFGTDGNTNMSTDPLAAAVENAWVHGITVVVSAGNSGFTAGPTSPLDNPAYDPNVIAVGATELVGNSKSNYELAPFTSKGVTSQASGRRDDVLAPGTSITSLADPGSMIDSIFPGGRVGKDFFKGTGTSQAAAVVSGAVALLLSRYPNLTPDAVKQLLMHGGTPVGGAGHKSNGSYSKIFQLDLGKDVLSKTAAPKYSAPPQIAYNGDLLHTAQSGFHLDSARGDMKLSYVPEGASTPTTLSGDNDVTGNAWDGTAWQQAWLDHWSHSNGTDPDYPGPWIDNPSQTMSNCVVGGGSWNHRLWRSLGWSNDVNVVDGNWQSRIWRDGGWQSVS